MFKSPELKHSPNTRFLQASVLNVPPVHEGKKSLNCNECNICFDKKGKLNEHIAAIHEGKRLKSLPLTEKRSFLLRILYKNNYIYD